MSPTSIFASASTPADAIVDLSFFVVAVAAGIFVAVAGLVAYAVVQFRKQTDDDHSEPAQVYGRPTTGSKRKFLDDVAGDRARSSLDRGDGGQALLGGAARIYVIGFLVLGTGLVCHASQLARERSHPSAHRLLLRSIVYLPALLLLMMAEKTWPAISVLARLSTQSG